MAAQNMLTLTLFAASSAMEVAATVAVVNIPHWQLLIQKKRENILNLSTVHRTDSFIRMECIHNSTIRSKKMKISNIDRKLCAFFSPHFCTTPHQHVNVNIIQPLYHRNVRDFQPIFPNVLTEFLPLKNSIDNLYFHSLCWHFTFCLYLYTHNYVLTMNKYKIVRSCILHSRNPLSVVASCFTFVSLIRVFVHVYPFSPTTSAK